MAPTVKASIAAVDSGRRFRCQQKHRAKRKTREATSCDPWAQVHSSILPSLPVETMYTLLLIRILHPFGTPPREDLAHAPSMLECFVRAPSMLDGGRQRLRCSANSARLTSIEGLRARRTYTKLGPRRGPSSHWPVAGPVRAKQEAEDARRCVHYFDRHCITEHKRLP